MHWRFGHEKIQTLKCMKNKQTNKQYKRILEQQVRLSEGSPAVRLSCYLSLKLTIRNSPQNLSF